MSGPDHFQVVIVGGGFGGLTAARALGRAPVRVTLVDRRNFHLFQPLLYQVATGGLSPGEIASPLRFVLRRQANAQVLLGEAIDLDPAARQLTLRDGSVAYDALVIATGSQHHYFGHPEWAAIAPGLKTIEDATRIRSRIFAAFEHAERASPNERAAWLTFVIVGGGPTGVELAGALAEIAHHTLRHDFRAIDPRSARLVLVEAGERVLGTYPPSLSERALVALKRLGIEAHTGCLATAVDGDGVTIKHGDQTERIAARTVIWAAGVAASPLGEIVARRTGAVRDRAGRLEVLPDLTLPGHPEIFVIGDLAAVHGPDGALLPGIAPVAIDEGKHVARVIRRRAQGEQGTIPFHYHHLGLLAVIGRGQAVADFGRFRLSGYIAWLQWLFIHLMKLIEFENRMLVLVQWAWEYVTWNRGARLITNIELTEEDEGKRPT
jgi:NADH dehydrogenase